MPDAAKSPTDAKLDAAISQAEAREQAAQVVQMVPIQVTISSTGRICPVVLPADVTEAELLELVGWLATQARPFIAQIRGGGGSRIVIPGR